MSTTIRGAPPRRIKTLSAHHPTAQPPDVTARRPLVEVRIGVQNVAREIVFQSEESADTVADAVQRALSGSGLVQLTDDKGSTILVPADTLGYVEIGASSERRVGFGAG
ncbi:MAG: DUF3107 domain-containing protein [Angustibacter sp.]